MSNNIVIDILQKQEEQRKLQAKQSEWGLSNVRTMTNILESNGANITSHMWDLLLFNINGLRINEAGRVCYISFYKPSKRILNLLARYNKVIVEHFDEITKTR